MNKIIKIFILLTISFSVYFIYKNTYNSKIKILNIGDGLATGINSYGIKDIGYIDYYKEYLKKDNKEIEIINEYSNKEQSIYNINQIIKNTSKIKKDLMDSHILIICLGYNDLLYKVGIENEIDDKKIKLIIKNITNEYENLLTQVKKYYKNEIIVLGYYKSNKDDYYINYSIKEINKYLKERKDIIYVDTYNALNNKKYFLNPNSYYPSIKGYKKISDKIIEKTLEK